MTGRKRDRLELYALVLKACRDKAKIPVYIQAESYIHLSILKKMLPHLVRCELLTELDTNSDDTRGYQKKYKTTAKGKHYLELFDEVDTIMKGFSHIKQ